MAVKSFFNSFGLMMDIVITGIVGEEFLERVVVRKIVVSAMVVYRFDCRKYRQYRSKTIRETGRENSDYVATYVEKKALQRMVV